MYNYTVKKLYKYVDSKYQLLVELILQVTLFGIEGFTSKLVKITNYSEQSIVAIIKKINHEDNIIKIDQQKHKPYKYSINLDVVSKLKES